MIARTLALVAASILILGCRSMPREPVPTYPMMDVPASLEVVCTRAATLDSVSGQGSLTLRDPKRGSIRMEAAFVLDPPDRARVRAWKFNQAVFDLTVRPDGAWLYAPREHDDGKAGSLTAGAKDMGASVRQWLGYLHAGVDFTDATVTSDGRAIYVTKRDLNGSTLKTTIDRRTLTVRSYVLRDSGGTERFRLVLDRYQLIAPLQPWPARIEARSGSGIIVIETSTIEANRLADNAFNPPARAIRLP